MQENVIVTPEQIWEKLTKLEKERRDADKEEELKRLRIGSLSDAIEDEQFTLLGNIAKYPNAEDIYLFCLQKDNKEIYFLLEDELQIIASSVINKPYADKILEAIMNHSEFKGFSPDVEFYILTKPHLRETYWQKGNDFSDETECVILTLPNRIELLSKYFSYGFGLCPEAQKKLFAIPPKQTEKLVTEFINGITEKNHSERTLCKSGFFMLLKNKPLFDLYVEKMSPFFKEKKYIFPQTIYFVVQRKGWL